MRAAPLAVYFYELNSIELDPKGLLADLAHCRRSLASKHV